MPMSKITTRKNRLLLFDILGFILYPLNFFINIFAKKESLGYIRDSVIILFAYIALFSCGCASDSIEDKLKNDSAFIIPKIDSSKYVEIILPEYIIHTDDKIKYIKDTIQKDTSHPKKMQNVQKVDDILTDVIYIEGGTFMMGCENGDDDEKPVHKVRVNSFYIDKYEVTVAKFKKFCKATDRQMPNAPPWGWHDNEPMVNVSWTDAHDYAIWAGKRLPTEAEWEYAAIGGSKSKNYKYCGSNDVKEVGVYKENSNNHPAPVGSKKPNEIGIYDMSGNVWEWCEDWYAKDYYKKSPEDNPKGPKAGDSPVLRGGSWHNSDENLRCTERSFNPLPAYRYFNIGFRCVQDLVPINLE